MRLVGYGTFKVVDGKLVVKFMGTYPVFDFMAWEVEVGDSDNIVEVLREKLNGHVVIKDWKDNEGVFGVYC
jgi:hypothetical protein